MRKGLLVSFVLISPVVFYNIGKLFFWLTVTSTLARQGVDRSYLDIVITGVLAWLFSVIAFSLIFGGLFEKCIRPEGVSVAGLRRNLSIGVFVVTLVACGLNAGLIFSGIATARDAMVIMGGAIVVGLGALVWVTSARAVQ
ncbi:hypothetical protein [Tritonibacter mobilis]|uniref:hypothetical protein n=1 Tax=Tritonibacter mobilis TaxID=379347 RepID=UPI000806E5AC|nr:hypothetical protein [Tritonibacter mobilis]